MRLRKRASPFPEVAVAPAFPIRLVPSAVGSPDVSALLLALEGVPEHLWIRRSSNPLESGFNFSGLSWMDLHRSRGMWVLPPKTGVLSSLANTVVEDMHGSLSTPSRILRVFVNRFEASRGAGKSPQWVLRPHVDSGDMSVVLSMRPAGTTGGLLCVSLAPDGSFRYKSSRPDTVDTRHNVKFLPCAHGDLTLFDGSVEHFVTSTRHGPRFSVVMFLGRPVTGRP